MRTVSLRAQVPRCLLFHARLLKAPEYRLGFLQGQSHSVRAQLLPLSTCDVLRLPGFSCLSFNHNLHSHLHGFPPCAAVGHDARLGRIKYVESLSSSVIPGLAEKNGKWFS